MVAESFLALDYAAAGAISMAIALAIVPIRLLVWGAARALEAVG